jgi:16S rRNA (guanine(1405)-N(7))-methyltransferase
MSPISEKQRIDPVEAVLSSRKYRELDIPPETAMDLYTAALHSGQTPKEAKKTLQQKLHNIIAPYLGDPDFVTAQAEMETAFSSADPDLIPAFCLKMLNSHASTRERVEILPDFYPRIFEVTGIPKSIHDLASGLNPFSLPWMNLEKTARYSAFDLNKPRVDLVRKFLVLSGRDPLGFHRDILLDPPEEVADVAFLFKEAHRMEQRQRGSTRKLIQSIKVTWFLLSLPPSSLQGKFDLTERQEKLVQSITSGTTWQVEKIAFLNELVFCIRKVMP